VAVVAVSEAVVEETPPVNLTYTVITVKFQAIRRRIALSLTRISVLISGRALQIRSTFSLRIRRKHARLI